MRLDNELKALAVAKSNRVSFHYSHGRVLYPAIVYVCATRRIQVLQYETILVVDVLD